MNAAVLELLKKTAAVPSMPQLVLRFLEVMQDPEFEYGDLAKTLSTDPGTVSEVLRLCNSALFGVRQKVVSLKQALALLGPKRTRSLLLGRYLVDSLAQKPPAGLDMNYFWRRSLASAVIAARLADEVLPGHREESFIAALLADIGIPILAEAAPGQYKPIVAHFTPNGKPFTAEDERKLVQCAHAEVSAMVLSHWTLPDEISKAVNLHQSTNPTGGEHADVARVIHVADRISRLLCEPNDAATILDVCAQAMEMLKRGPDLVAKILPTVETDIRELASVLRIEVVAGKAYSAMLRALQPAGAASS